MRHRAQTNKNNKITKLLAKLQVAVCLVLFIFLGNPAYAITPEEARAQLENIKNQNNEASSKITELQSQKRTLSNEFAILDMQIDQIQLNINAAQYEIDITSSEINTTNTQIEKAQEEMQKQKDFMNEYLRTIYVEGQVSTIELIARSKNFSDFVDQSEYLGVMQQNVQETANIIFDLKEELEKNKANLDLKKSKAEQLKSEALSQKNQLDIQISQKNFLIQQTNGSESAYQDIIKNNNSQKGILECIANGGCQGDSSGSLIVTNTWPHYYQWDSGWGNYVYDPPDNTLEEFGCLITSLAMVHTFYGNVLNPQQEAQRHSYINGNLVGGIGTNVTNNWNAINVALANHKPVIVGLRMSGGGYWSHFVVIMSSSDGKYFVNDPYFSSGRTYEASRIFAAYIPY